MSNDRAARDAWVGRVLAVAITGTAVKPQGAGAGDFLASWKAATDSIARQLAGLAEAMRATGEPNLRSIADGALADIMGGLDIALTSALQQLADSDAPGEPTRIAKAIALCRRLRRHVATDRRIAVCDRNPWGVKVTIGGTLAAVLAEVETALAR